MRRSSSPSRLAVMSILELTACVKGKWSRRQRGACHSAQMKDTNCLSDPRHAGSSASAGRVPQWQLHCDTSSGTAAQTASSPPAHTKLEHVPASLNEALATSCVHAMCSHHTSVERFFSCIRMSNSSVEVKRIKLSRRTIVDANSRSPSSLSIPARVQ